MFANYLFPQSVLESGLTGCDRYLAAVDDKFQPKIFVKPKAAENYFIKAANSSSNLSTSKSNARHYHELDPSNFLLENKLFA